MIKIKTGRNTIMGIILMVSVLTTTIVYSAFSTKLQINGEAVLRSMNEIRITNMEIISYTNGIYETYNSKYTKDTISIYSTLPANSNITYEVTITNGGTIDYIVESINTLTHDNSSVNVSSDIRTEEIVNKNDTKKFTVTLSNNTETEQKITLVNQYKFKAIIQEYSVEVAEGKYYIGSTNEKIPVIITNNNPYTISGNVTYEGKVLYNNFTIPANTEYGMIHVPIDETTYNSLVEGVENKLSINITSPAERNYNDKVVFTKKLLPVSIVNVTSNTGTISFTQDTVNIDNNLTSETKKANYTITLRNNITNDDYKLRNITQVHSNNKNFSYTSNIDLSEGIYVKRNDEYTFELSYIYDVSKDNTHRDVLRFELQKDYSGSFIRENLISLSIPQTNDENNYGDFPIIDSGYSFQVSQQCSYAKCYSDNGGKYQYDSDGGLILDSNNPIGILNIDQSMSIKDEFSVHMTVKGASDQHGVPSNDTQFMGTIVAVSENVSSKLAWIGYRSNKFIAYSYNGGSVTADIASYDNKIINVTVTATRGGKTRIYINGVLSAEGASGSSVVNYTAATLGDLRPGRGLKFTGTLYELLFYNRELSAAEVQQNWNVTNTNWHIN